MKIPLYNVKRRKKGVTATLKFINNKAYNELIFAQEYTAYFKIVEEEKMKFNKYGEKRQVWVKFSGKFDPTTGASKTILRKESVN